MTNKLLQYYVRHFPFDMGKNRAISLFWRPLSLGHHRSQETRLTQGDVRVKCDLDQLLQRQLYFWGSYEPEYCELWIRLCKTANTVFDVGANVGLYSLLACAANPKVSIHAFEPTPEMVERFNENIFLNGFKNITVNKVAVGRSKGNAVLRECKGSDGVNEGMNFVVSGNGSLVPTDRVIPLTSLDDYCRDGEIERIDLLKIDIEGGEYEALTGARSLLNSGSIGCIFVEFVDWAAKRSNHSIAELQDLLVGHGYALHQLRGAKLEPVVAGSPPDNENVVALSPRYDFALGKLTNIVGRN